MRRIRTGKRVELTERDFGLIQAAPAVGPHATRVAIAVPGHDKVDGMSSFERTVGKTNRQEQLRQKFRLLREQVHNSMKAEEEVRLRENPKPTEEELYMGAFVEWLEPQVRTAVVEMNRKGYATQSSGFHGTQCEIQTIDGILTIDEKTKAALKQMGVDVWRGPDIGVPKNKLVTMLRFHAKYPSVEIIREQWDAVAAVLPKKAFPAGIRPICDRAEIFREEYAPEHPSLEEARYRYFDYQRTEDNGLNLVQRVDPT
jgi:hypothetical protein